uniref:Uncharacterized protein n=2 Tax=Physcomitrium patens TaxID=3218 RepID=A0A2K1IV07_PHYPA|nr:hypothetical protein PHYPA_025054 [Physcomitrium patens]
MLERQESLPGTSARDNRDTEMLSDVAMQFAPRAEPMAGRTKMEPWSQHDEYSFMTESVSPLARTPAFWEHVMHNQVESGNLFSMTTPHVDTRLQPSTPTFYSYGCETSQGSDSTGSSYSDQQGERIKRRRMLQFTGVNTGGFAHDSPLPHESVVGSPSTTYSSSYAGSPLSSVFSGDDYMLQPYCSPGLTTSPWFTGSDATTSFVLPNSQQPVETWSSLPSFEKNQSYSAPVQINSSQLPMGSYIPNSLGENYSPQPWKRPTPLTPQSSFSQNSNFSPKQLPLQMQFQQPFQYQQTQPRLLHPKAENGQLQNPLIPFSKPPTPGRKSSSGLSRFKTKSLMPIALPFAMLKPSAAQGDVTLNDINKLLLSPPPTPTDRPSPVDEKRPRSPPGAGLSGKSVVACTKIHTEGAGTITIMRTKG